MIRPRLLDLFCGAGGAAMGYHRAGFDVVGVDIKPQRRYPFEFRQADALWYLEKIVPTLTFDAIHASPPCQDHMRSRLPGQATHNTGWMLPATRKLLEMQHRPWVIENVPGALLRVDYLLCGCMFDLPLLSRQRWFETSWHAFELRAPCQHPDGSISVVGHDLTSAARKQGYTKEDRKRAMGIDWMDADELGLAIPPAYTEHIGRQLLEHLEGRAA